MFDGHLTHTPAPTIELAIRENISILKLPAHTTDVLQPLDVACFGPLKSYYEKALTEHVHQTGARQPLRRANFVNLIAGIWRNGLSARNIKAGFEATGVYPVNSAKYKIEQLDKVKLKTYEQWKSTGSPVDSDGQPKLDELEPEQYAFKHSTSSPQPSTSQENPTLQEEATPLLGFTSLGTTPSSASSPPPSSAATASEDGVKVPARRALWNASTKSVESNTHGIGYCVPDNPKSLMRALQKYAPQGMRYSVMLMNKEDESTFNAVIKSHGRPSIAPAQTKRHKISMHSAIITDKEVKKQSEERKIQDKKKMCSARSQKE